MKNSSIESYIQRYCDKSGMLDLARVLDNADCLGVKTVSYLQGHKKLTKLILPDNSKFIIKPTSPQGASAEKIISHIYKNSGIETPDITIATLDGIYYVVANDILSSKNHVNGKLFLEKITPVGAQYALPEIFGNDKVNKKVTSFFKPYVLKQIAEHYGMALATGNWDANISGLGFVVKNKKNERASGVVALNFEESLSSDYGIGYANPFSPHRLSRFKVINFYKNSNKPFINRNEIAKKINKGVEQIDEIVRKCKDEGFVPDEDFTDELKFSMDEMSNIFQR